MPFKRPSRYRRPVPPPPPKLKHLMYEDSDHANLREYAGLGTTVLDRETFVVDEFEFIRLMFRDADGLMTFDEVDGQPLTIPIWEDDIFLFDEDGTVYVRYLDADAFALRDNIQPKASVRILDHDRLTYAERELPLRNQIYAQDRIMASEFISPSFNIPVPGYTDSDTITFTERDPNIRTVLVIDGDIAGIVEESERIRVSLSDSDASRATDA